MSGVNRYNCELAGMMPGKDGVWVQAYLYDAVQSELSALREENERLKSESFEGLYNAVIDERDALREELDKAVDLAGVNLDALIAAEQRNAELERLAREAMEILKWDKNGSPSVNIAVRIYQLLEPAESASDVCTSCDGSGEYIDAIGDWRGYCSCPAGVALKNKPTESGASE